MPAPRLLLVTDLQRTHLPLPVLTAEAVAGGVDAIYLRHLSSGDDWVESLRRIRDRIPTEVLLMVPGDSLCSFAGVGRHLREREAIPRETLGISPALISRSVHSPAEAARSFGFQYLVAGHVFASLSKPGQQPLGLEGLTSIVAAAPVPVVAIGGVTPIRVADVIAAGAQGVAVIGAICEAPDPRGAARELREAVDAALSTSTKGSSMTSTPIDEATITISVNGKPREIAAGGTVHDLLASRRLADSMAIVERNGIILPRDSYATTVLVSGDQLEVVHAVGGG